MAAILLYDGVCNLCNFWVKFCLKFSKNNALYFASLQSKAGHKLLSRFNMDTNYMHSLVLIANGKAYTQSIAALYLCFYLYWPWRVFLILFLIPLPLRNWTYRYIAKHRYTWFGKQQACIIPKPEWGSRFIETETDLNRLETENLL